MAKRLRALFLYHSIISPLCLVWVRAPHWPRETSQVLLAGVSGDNLKRDIKLKKKKKTKLELSENLTIAPLLSFFAG